MEIVHKAEGYAIMGAGFEVYREMGCGFTEPVYQECLEIERLYYETHENGQERTMRSTR